MIKYLLSLLLFITSMVNAQTVYKVSLFRAAPGELMTLIENLKERRVTYEKLGGDKPYMVRHSQGDHWDIMVYEHIGNMREYFNQKENLNVIFTPSFGSDFYKLVSHHETIYAEGDEYEVVAGLFDNSGYFHVEMFNTLAGKQKELLKQREMENIYLKEIGRKPNLIFTVNQGANWDCFTLGGYRDIKHFAESADIPLEVEEKAAIKAGFKGVNDISPYLRSLISKHQDTLGGKIN